MSDCPAHGKICNWTQSDNSQLGTGSKHGGQSESDGLAPVEGIDPSRVVIVRYGQLVIVRLHSQITS